MGEVAVGDELIGADGRPTRVVAATEVLVGRPVLPGRVLRRHGDRRRRRAPVADRVRLRVRGAYDRGAGRRAGRGPGARGAQRGAVARSGRLDALDDARGWSAAIDAGWKIVAIEPVDVGAGALRRGRQRRPSLPRRPVDDPDPQLDPRARHRPVGVDQARLTSVIFSLEMSRTEITMRLLSAEARIPLNHMRNGKMSDDDWNKLVRKMGEVSEAPLFIDDSPNLTMMEIRAKARRLKQRHDLRLIIIDYLQLMTSGKKVESRQLEVSEFSRQIKLLAKELEVPVIAISQLNRGSEQRTSKRPLLSDLRESGSLEQDADMVILLHREDIYEQESTRPGEADLIVAKHRNGPTARPGARLPGPLLALRRHGPGLTSARAVRRSARAVVFSRRSVRSRTTLVTARVDSVTSGGD